MLTDEQKTQLKTLLDAGVLTQAEYDAKVSPKEGWNTKKFLAGMFSAFDGVQWGKDIAGVFNIRKIIIYLLILGAIFGWGYAKGLRNKPVHIDNLGGKEAVIEIQKDKMYLHITKEGAVQVEDEKGKKLKTITVKDIPALQKQLQPVGLEFKPFATMGAGVGTSGKSGIEGGLGFSYFKFYKVHLDVFATNYGLYPIGVDYRLTDNFSAIMGVGKGYTGDDTRFYLGGKWSF